MCQTSGLALPWRPKNSPWFTNGPGDGGVAVVYPLVNLQKTMGNHNVYPFLVGKSTSNGHFQQQTVSLAVV